MQDFCSQIKQKIADAHLKAYKTRNTPAQHDVWIQVEAIWECVGHMMEAWGALQIAPEEREFIYPAIMQVGYLTESALKKD